MYVGSIIQMYNCKVCWFTYTNLQLQCTLVHSYKCTDTMYLGSPILMRIYNVRGFAYTNVQLQCTLVHLYKCTTIMYVGSLKQTYKYNVRWFTYTNAQLQCTLVHKNKCTTIMYVGSLKQMYKYKFLMWSEFSVLMRISFWMSYWWTFLDGPPFWMTVQISMTSLFLQLVFDPPCELWNVH